MKHNQQLCSQRHFRKDWEKHVKTWFDQPAGKQRRRNARIAKAKKVAPRPVNLLRPAVRCPTVKYNMRVRAGRGFTIEELKAAKINKKAARGVGIAVDHRRSNRSDESFQANVQRLKLYKSKLVVFPRKAFPKGKDAKAKSGDSTEEQCKAVVQVTSKMTLPLAAPFERIKARKITKDEAEANVVSLLRKSRTDAKLWGIRERRAAVKAEAAPGLASAVKDTAANADAKAFLTKYSSESDTTELPSGLIYKVLKKGPGGSPKVNTPCSCHYEGRLSSNYPSGETFDSSYSRGQPTTFAPNQVIKAWTEAMQLMTVGSMWELVCPPEIAYGSRSMGAKIPANSVLVFTMEMLSCNGVADK